MATIVLKDKAQWEAAIKKVNFLKAIIPRTRKRDNQIKHLVNAIEAFEIRCQVLKDKYDLIKSGYAGVNQQGAIVDRRVDGNAIPIPAGNGAPEPKPII